MSTVEVIEQPVTVTVSPSQTVTVTETPVTVEVTVDGSVTVTESPTTVTVQGGDSVTVQESPVTVEIDAVGHPRTHPIGGDSHQLSGLTVGDVLTALGPTSAAFAPPTGGGGTPGDTVVSETAFGQAAAAGVLLPFSRIDHTHGSPVNPVTAHEAAGDPHALYPLSAQVETISGVWTFSAIHKSNPAAVGIVYEAYVAAQTFAAIRLATDTGLGFGAGTSAPTHFMRRSTGLASGVPTNAGWEFVRSLNTLARLIGLKTTDTEPHWVFGTITESIGTAGFGLGPGGASPIDTTLARLSAGKFEISDSIRLKGHLEIAAGAAPNIGAFAFYSKFGLGGKELAFYQDSTGRENGPLGTLHNIFGPGNFLFGQFAVMGQPDDDSAPGLSGVAATGLLANPALVGTATTVPLNWFAYGSGLPFFEISTSGALNAVAGLYWPLHTLINTDPSMSVQFQFGLMDTGTATSATTTTVTDTTKSPPGWVVNEWAGGTIKIDVGGISEVRTIASNTATVITVSSAFSGVPAGVYVLVGPKEANGRLFIGWSDQSLATMVGSDNPAGNYIGLQYSSARGDTDWQFVSKDGTTQNLVAVGLPAGALSQAFRMIFDHDVGMTLDIYNAGWGAGTSALFLLADPIPGAVPLRLIAGYRALAASVKKLRIQFINEVSGF